MITAGTAIFLERAGGVAYRLLLVKQIFIVHIGHNLLELQISSENKQQLMIIMKKILSDINDVTAQIIGSSSGLNYYRQLIRFDRKISRL